MTLAQARLGHLSTLLLAPEDQHRSIGTGLVLLLLALFVLFRYGLTREPLYFNQFNPWKKPLPVWAARLIYVPLAALLLYWGLRNLVGR